MAVITKVEGDGVAKVRRKSGIQSVAGKQQKLFPGDTITTDAKSTVEMILPDGTLVRVGLNTDYKITSVEKKKGFLSWVFGMTKGSIRALVEKGVNKKQVKFRVNTPVGTMGVRGTELVLVHDPKTAITTLYTIEGLVEFGEKKCTAKRSCIEVKTGETASVGGSKAGKPTAKTFSSSDLLGVKAKAAGDQANSAKGDLDGSVDPNSVLSRASLFESPKEAEQFAQNSSEGINAVSKGDLDALVKKASEAMAEAQDGLIGRTKADRMAIHHAIQDGTLGSRLKLAEKFDDIKSGKKDSASMREQENLSATALADKFKLARAILNSKKPRMPFAPSMRSVASLYRKRRKR